MNVVLVIIDSLRKDHVGAYGNDWIHTPHLDAFAGESVRFTHCYPESLPTLPMRRATHTGIRTFPYHGHRNYKGDFAGAPGWGPIPEEQDTLAELLRPAGYRCAFITDTYHQFKPSKNFHRGFDEWIWVRGQETDRYRSGPAVPKGRLQQHMNDILERDTGMSSFLDAYLRNNSRRVAESDYYPARVFTEASRWVWDNTDAEDFLLIVDSFDPHEPWDPPAYYRKMYDPDDDVIDMIQSLYGAYEGVLTPREVKRMQANYAGEVTMVDRWFGFFMENLRLAGRLEDTVVAVISDHGHNVGHEPGDKGLISKQGHPMTHGVADLVLMLRNPADPRAGTTYDRLVYNVDLTATLLGMAGVAPKQPIDGIDFWPKVATGEKIRDHVSIGWGPLITVITEEWWYNASIWGEGELLYRVAEDPDLEHNLAEEHPDVCQEMLKLVIEDAGGSIPEAFKSYHNRPGCTPFEDRSGTRSIATDF